MSHSCLFKTCLVPNKLHVPVHMYMYLCSASFTAYCMQERRHSETALPLTFPHWQDVDKIFGNLPELYELSVQLLASLEECIEMAGEMEGKERCPQAGFVFEELAEVREGRS